jgi:thymidylate synthase
MAEKGKRYLTQTVYWRSIDMVLTTVFVRIND